MQFWIYLAAYFVGLSLFAHLLFFFSRSFAEASRKVPLLDLWVAGFVWAPPVVAGILQGWVGLVICLGTQTAYLLIYSFFHSLISFWRQGHRGGRLMNSLAKSLGRGRVFIGFIVTLLAVPVFLVLRLGQIFVYPLLSLSVDFPKYKHGDWIQLSRHKFEGLVGLDLLWCLYCEWAAGVYALGGEMVRNNESFWCPIRFYENKHCENCKLDFPDLGEWVPQSGKIEDVESLLENKYPPGKSPRAWYQHPSRKN